MAEGKILEYKYIRLEPADNGFALSYECVKENLMAPKSDYGCCGTMYEDKREVFEAAEDTGGWEGAFDRAAGRMKEIYMHNRDYKK